MGILKSSKLGMTKCYTINEEIQVKRFLEGNVCPEGIPIKRFSKIINIPKSIKENMMNITK